MALLALCLHADHVPAWHVLALLPLHQLLFRQRVVGAPGLLFILAKPSGFMIIFGGNLRIQILSRPVLVAHRARVDNLGDSVSYVLTLIVLRCQVRISVSLLRYKSLYLLDVGVK